MPVAAIADVQSRVVEIENRIAALRGGNMGQSENFANVLGAALRDSNGSASSRVNSNNPIAAALGGLRGGATGQQVVDIAKQWMGTPYVWGGNTPGKGLDCSGLVQQAFRKVGIELPRVAADQARAGTKVESLAQAKPGDLVAFGSPVDHIGIYVGDNKMLVAPRKGDVVKIQEVYKTPTAIRRIVPDTPPAAAMSAANATGFTNSVSNLMMSASGRSNATGAISANLQSRYNDLFVQAGAKYNISPNLLAAVAKTESNFNPTARSGAGAQGLMQIMPATARGLGVNALDPVQAVDGAAKMLSGLITKFGSVELALAGYNAGPGAVQKYGGIPPYRETQNYVKKITGLLRG